MRALLLAGLTLASTACTPPCDDTPWQPSAVCHRADAGALMANQPFTLIARTSASGTCRAVVDGGAIDLSIEGHYCGTSSTSGAAAPREAAEIFLPCEVPALPAGTYVVTSGATFTLPASADAGLSTCP